MTVKNAITKLSDYPFEPGSEMDIAVQTLESAYINCGEYHVRDIRNEYPVDINDDYDMQCFCRGWQAAIDRLEGCELIVWGGDEDPGVEIKKKGN